MSVLLTPIAIGLACSGYVRLGSYGGIFDLDDGEWEATERNFVLNDEFVSGIPLPEGFDFYRIEIITPRQEMDEFRFMARLTPENWRDRTTAGMSVTLSFAENGVRQLNWNAGELIGSHRAFNISSGRFACAEDPVYEDTQ